MNTDIIGRILKSREYLKQILADEWDTSVIQDYSKNELEKIYNLNIPKSSNISSFGHASGCNITLNHKYIPSHKLHVIYYNFPEIGRNIPKITKQCGDKLVSLYTDEIIENEDSILFITIDRLTDNIEKTISSINIQFQESLQKTGLPDKIMKENNSKKIPFQYSLSHFKKIHIFHIYSLTIDLQNHIYVPKHICIRDKKVINKLLKETNTTLKQLPVIKQSDIQAKLLRLSPGDVCKIIRKTNIGELITYRICQ
jgi:DNA-directed RNA polymerase subunit H (RpoH/RPB5)